MKNHFKIIALFSLQTVNLHSVPEYDKSNFAYDITKLIVTEIAGLAIPRFVNNPPQTNIREYIASKFDNNNAKIDAELAAIEIKIAERKTEYKACDDYPTKRRLKEELKELKEKRAQLEEEKMKKVGIKFSNSRQPNPTKEEIIKENVFQEQILTIPLNKKSE